MPAPLRFLPLLLFTLILTATSRGEVPDDPRHRSQRKDKPSAREIEQEREWIAVDKTSSVALQAYLDKKPRGSRNKEAALLLPIATKLDAVMAGKVKPAVVLSLEPFQKEAKNYAKKSALAISYNAKFRTGEDVGACWAYGSIDYEDPSSFSKGKFAATQYASFPGSSMIAPGSIAAFDSGGERPPVEQLDDFRRKLPVIITARSGVAYFGLVENVGWVHLAGEGEVVYPDGKRVKFR
jgi:hypothetical protein